MPGKISLLKQSHCHFLFFLKKCLFSKMLENKQWVFSETQGKLSWSENMFQFFRFVDFKENIVGIN